MTANEARDSHCVCRMTTAAINSNRYADMYPDKAAKGIEDAKAYAEYLRGFGHTVDLEIVDNRVKTMTYDGKTIVKNGAYAQ